MKKTLLLAAGLTAAFAAPAFAATGYVGANYDHVAVDTTFGDDDTSGWGVNGAVALAPADSPFGFVVNGGVNDGEDSDTVLGVNGHAFLRTGAVLVGGFVGLSDSDDASSTSGGIEGQMQFGNLTAAAAGTIGTIDLGFGDADVKGLDAQARFFLNDNLRLQGNVGWANLDAGAEDADVTSAGADAEYQFASTPFSVFGGYTYTTSEELDLDSAQVIRIGARVNFGGTLKDRDNSGAGFAGLSSAANLLSFGSF